MTDPLDRTVRDALRKAALPPAPEALREFLADLPITAPTRPARRDAPRLAILVAATVVVAAASITALSLVGATNPQPSAPSPAPSVMASEPDAARFEAPGFSIVIPARWIDRSTVVEFPDIPGQRFVGLLARGMNPCAIRYGAAGGPTPHPSSCQEAATQPGTGLLSVMELPHQYPFLTLPGDARVIAGYQGWERVGADRTEWLVRAPDDGIYLITLISPAAGHGADILEVGTALDTLKLAAWEPEPVVVDGRIHEDPKQGFSFDYPAGWLRYYPMDISTMDGAVVTVASSPLLPPCADQDRCQRFSTPASTVVIEFRIGSGPTPPDWSTAPTTVGGQPAFVEDWGSTNATQADEGHSWSVRLDDRKSLGIYASLRGPDLPRLVGLMNEILASVKITSG